jgi:hypothetical protein
MMVFIATSSGEQFRFETRLDKSKVGSEAPLMCMTRNYRQICFGDRRNWHQPGGLRQALLMK